MSAMRALALPETDAESQAAATWTVPAQAPRVEAVPAHADRPEAAPAQPARTETPRDQAPGGQVAGSTAVRGRAASAEAVRTRAGHAQAGHARAGHAEAGHARAGHAEAGHAEAGHAEAGHAEAGHAETARIRVEPDPAARSTATRGRPAPGTPVRGQAARGQAAAAPLRLTRRGRVVVAVAAALLLVGLLSLLATGVAQATSHSVPSGLADRNLTQVVVRPGQSLWSVAQTADPNADPRQVMQQIMELNGLTNDVILAGQQLWVPRG